MSEQKLIRYSPERAVRVAWEPEPGSGCRLVAVHPVDGPLPDVAHLLAVVFPEELALSNAVRSAMSPHAGDTLDRTLITPEAYQAWLAQAKQAAQVAIARGVPVEKIPDECATALPTGELLIWVDLPEVGRVELKIPATAWTWRQRFDA